MGGSLFLTMHTQNHILKEKSRMKDKEMKEREFEIQRLKIDLEIYQQNSDLFSRDPNRQKQQQQQPQNNSPDQPTLPIFEKKAPNPLLLQLDNIEKKLNELLEEDLSSVQSLHDFSLPSDVFE